MSFQSAALLVAWFAITLLAFAMSGLLRQIRSLESAVTLRRVTIGPTLGAPAPELDGHAWDRRTVLLFVDADCNACERALSELGETADGLTELDLVALFRDRPNGIAGEYVRTLASQGIAFSDYRVPLTPFAITVSSKGTIADASAVGAPLALSEFVNRAKERAATL